MRRILRDVVTSAAAVIVAGSAWEAQGSVFTFERLPGSGGLHVGTEAGRFPFIGGSFDEHEQRLQWEVIVEPNHPSGYQKADLLALAISDGANPRGDAGELALIYLDATDVSNPELLIYAYNGAALLDSFQDGDSTQSGDQAPDTILTTAAGSGLPSWVFDLQVNDLSDGTRQFIFDIDVTEVNSHVPLYPDPVEPWRGAEFDSGVGFWIHALTDVQTSFDQNGFFDDIMFNGNRSFADTMGPLDTTEEPKEPPIPEPGVLGLVAAGAMMSVTRRRRIA